MRGRYGGQMSWPLQLVVLLAIFGIVLLVVRQSLANDPKATMLHIEESLPIARLPEEVFAFLADPRNDTILSARVIQVELVSLGPPRVGTTYREKVRIGAAVRTLACTITDYDAPHHVGLRCDDDGRPLLGGYRVAPDGAGSVVTAISGTPHTITTAIFAPLIKALVRRECRAALHNLREAMTTTRA